jgi:hypothetical protein
VLALCAKAGLVSVALVAIDGSLIAGNAPPAATKTYAAIRAESDAILERAAQATLKMTSGSASSAATSCRRNSPTAACAVRGYESAAASKPSRPPNERLTSPIWRGVRNGGRARPHARWAQADADLLAQRKLHTTDPDTPLDETLVADRCRAKTSRSPSTQNHRCREGLIRRIDRCQRRPGRLPGRNGSSSPRPIPLKLCRAHRADCMARAASPS